MRFKKRRDWVSAWQWNGHTDDGAKLFVNAVNIDLPGAKYADTDKHGAIIIDMPEVPGHIYIPLSWWMVKKGNSVIRMSNEDFKAIYDTDDVNIVDYGRLCHLCNNPTQAKYCINTTCVESKEL